jgi:hypothetical protein
MTNPMMYGSCDVQHGKSITWNMESGDVKNFEFVPNYDLGGSSSGIDKNNDVIARYQYLTDSSGNFYLWLTCDKWQSEYNREQFALNLSGLGKILVRNLPLFQDIGSIVI